MKAIRDWHWQTGGPSSILLMVITSEVYEKNDRRDDLALLKVLEKISEKLKNGICNPRNPEESLTNRLGEKNVQEAANYFDIVFVKFKNALNSINKDISIQYLEEIFGNRFYFNYSDILFVENNLENTQLLIKSPNYITDYINYIFTQLHLKPLIYPENIKGTCSINFATITSDGYTNKKYYTTNSFPKYVSVEFNAQTDITFPYNVCWRVTNTGKEAKNDGDLRGNAFKIKEMKKEIKHTETTKYKGIHSIECFIIKNEEIVAISEPFIVLIK